MNEAIDTVILHNELAYADVLPVRFVPFEAPPDAALLANWSERNLRMLQASAALEEQGAAEKTDDETVHGAQVQRIDLKVNLLLDLVGHLVAASQSRPPAAPLRMNVRGIVWHCGGPRPTAAARGCVEVHLRECLVQPLALTGVVVEADADGHVHVAFDPLPDVVSDQFERLIFRRHRRHIAGVRQTRRP
jgi:hypothetical protein